jgi:uncharacterized RDD family membrane protein YckC
VQESGMTAPRPGVDTQYAGFWRRFASLFIDGAILLVVGSIVALILPGGREGGLAQAVNALLGIAYQVYFFTSTGQTIGMKVLGTKLIDGNGGLLSMGSAVVRVIGSYVSAIILFIGFLMMLWDGKKQTLHDKMAGSYVVMA